MNQKVQEYLNAHLLTWIIVKVSKVGVSVSMADISAYSRETGEKL